MDAGGRQEARSNCFSTPFTPNVFPSIDYYIIILTVADGMVMLRFVNTARTVLGSKKARIQYDNARIFNGDDTRIVYLFTVSLLIWKSIGDDILCPTILSNCSVRMFCLGKTCMCFGLHIRSG